MEVPQSLHIKILRSAFKSCKYPEFMVLAKGQYIGHLVDLVWWQPLKKADKMRHVFFAFKGFPSLNGPGNKFLVFWIVCHFAGYECWILPDLSEGVVINDGEVVANRLLAACAPWLKGLQCNVCKSYQFGNYTLPYSNMSPKNRLSQTKTSIPTIFRCELSVSGRVTVDWVSLHHQWWGAINYECWYSVDGVRCCQLFKGTVSQPSCMRLRKPLMIVYVGQSLMTAFMCTVSLWVFDNTRVCHFFDDSHLTRTLRSRFRFKMSLRFIWVNCSALGWLHPNKTDPFGPSKGGVWTFIAGVYSSSK